MDRKNKILYSLCLFLFVNFIIYSADPSLNSTSVQNWEEGKIYSKVSLDIERSGLQLPSDRNASFQLIERYMPSLLKDIYLSVIVDSSHRVGNYLAEEKINLNSLNKIIEYGQHTEPAFSTDLKNAVIKVSAPTHEIAKLFVRHKHPYTPTIPPGNEISKVYTGILIDARGQLPVHGEYVEDQLNPCLFPKIWNTDMSKIYEKNMVDPSVMKNKNIVAFSSSLNEELYRDRIGANPLRIIARGVFGENRTDPIISLEDSGQIISRSENLQLLKEGKIVIICDENKIRITEPFTPPSEDYYFTYHNIDLLLKKAKGKKIEVSNPNNIIKITMYDVRFVANKPDVLPSEAGKIDIIAEALSKVGPYAKFLIEGHTADLNRPHEEQILSVQRAEKIAEEIAKRGIDRNKISTVGYGSSRPIAPSNNEKNMAKNRRVVITVIRE